MSTMTLEPVTPQPSYIESSGRWEWPLPECARFPGCCTSVVTASREWWEYTPSEARPHPMAEAVQLRDGQWYWAVPGDAHLRREVKVPDALLNGFITSESYGPDKDYRLVIRFNSLNELQEAHRVLVGVK